MRGVCCEEISARSSSLSPPGFPPGGPVQVSPGSLGTEGCLIIRLLLSRSTSSAVNWPSSSHITQYLHHTVSPSHISTINVWVAVVARILVTVSQSASQPASQAGVLRVASIFSSQPAHTQSCSSLELGNESQRVTTAAQTSSQLRTILNQRVVL